MNNPFQSSQSPSGQAYSSSSYLSSIHITGNGNQQGQFQQQQQQPQFQQPSQQQQQQPFGSTLPFGSQASPSSSQLQYPQLQNNSLPVPLPQQQSSWSPSVPQSSHTSFTMNHSSSSTGTMPPSFGQSASQGLSQPLGMATGSLFSQQTGNMPFGSSGQVQQPSHMSSAPQIQMPNPTGFQIPNYTGMNTLGNSSMNSLVPAQQSSSTSPFAQQQQQNPWSPGQSQMTVPASSNSLWPNSSGAMMGGNNSFSSSSMSMTAQQGAQPFMNTGQPFTSSGFMQQQQPQLQQPAFTGANALSPFSGSNSSQTVISSYSFGVNSPASLSHSLARPNVSAEEYLKKQDDRKTHLQACPICHKVQDADIIAFNHHINDCMDSYRN